MLSSIHRIAGAGTYRSTFIPVSDAILWPHEAKTIERLTRRTTVADEPLDYVQITAIAKEARRAYLSEAFPRWRKAAGTALLRTGQAVVEAFAGVGRWLETQDEARRERYLAQATDIYDLERRIRALERQSVRGCY